MKPLLKRGALSARQRAAHGNSITAILISLIFLLPLVSSCRQEANSPKGELKKGDSLARPNVDVKVNRRYDKNGNVIGFDSTYTSYYSNLEGDTARMDSLMGSFDKYFRQEHSSFLGRQFDPLFFNDSSRYPDFFHNDFFMKRYELNDLYMRGMMQRMDSIKNRFYKENRHSGKPQNQ